MYAMKHKFLLPLWQAAEKSTAVYKVVKEDGLHFF